MTVGTTLDGDLPEVTVIESLCVQCHENGETRLMLSKIPFFREVIIASFECLSCGFRNNDVQHASAIAEKGHTITLTLRSDKDLDRQIIKSEHATLSVPCLEFSIPPLTQKGVATTVEGFLTKAADALEADQPARILADSDTALKIQVVINRLRDLASRNVENFPFEIVLDDPSGSSAIESLTAPSLDSQIKVVYYTRTSEQLHGMGFYEEQSTVEEKKGEDLPIADDKTGADLPEDLKAPKCWDLAANLGENPDDAVEKISFPTYCPHCGKSAAQNMCEVDIPGFRKCIVMSFVCDFCGSRSNDIKAGGAVGAKAKRWELVVDCMADLNRDVLKGDNAAIEIPSLDLKLEAGSLGGVFTTVEGIIRKVGDEIEEKFPFVGDSTEPERKNKVLQLIASLRKMASGDSMPFELILDDASDLSHIGRRGDDILFLTGSKKKEGSKETELQAAEELRLLPDPNLRIIEYERTFEQKEMLGLNDMVLENYTPSDIENH